MIRTGDLAWAAGRTCWNTIGLSGMRGVASTQLDEEIGLMIKTEAGDWQACARLAGRLVLLWSPLIVPTQFGLWRYISA